ncbi:MAG TPA: hypothetical protein VGM73_11715 [Candidatus Didemnitutus sp.]|jgi:hypothetical protein
MLRTLTSPRYAGLILAGAILAEYGVLPQIIARIDPEIRGATLLRLSLLSTVGLLLGAYGPWGAIRLHWRRLAVPSIVFHLAVWLPFVAFVVVTFASAPAIPLVAALRGAGSEEISLLRESFLKAREGWASSLVYISAILTGSILPYSLALMFVRRAWFRWPCLLFLVLYSVSFVEKAYFLKVAIPFIYLVSHRRIRIVFPTWAVLAATLSVIIGITVASKSDKIGAADRHDFFTVRYEPSGPVDLLIWRALAVPVITASDALRLFDEDFGQRPLRGATSSLLAGVTRVERVPYERMVYAMEFGQNETGTGSANSVFFTEAYVNFGEAGVVAVALLAGLGLFIFRSSDDEAFRSLSPLFCFGLFVSGLTGLLFSNGFIVVLGASLVLRVKGGEPARGAPSDAASPPHVAGVQSNQIP